MCVEACPFWVYDPFENERRCVDGCQDGSSPEPDGHCGSCAESDQNVPLYADGECTGTCPDTSPFYH